MWNDIEILKLPGPQRRWKKRTQGRVESTDSPKSAECLETAFGIADSSENCKDLPGKLDEQLVAEFFERHATLQAKAMKATPENLVGQLNGQVPHNGPEEHKLMLLLILGFGDVNAEDQIAAVCHKPTGVLLPTINGSCV